MLRLLVITWTVLAVTSNPFWVVYIKNGTEPMPTQLAVQVCAGLLNRDPSIAGAAYVLQQKEDEEWLHDTHSHIDNRQNLSASEFVDECLTSGLVKGYIRYEFHKQRIVLPNIITVAAVLDAVPLERDNADLPLAFDAIKEFHEFTAYDATKYVYEHWVNETTAIAKTNPGLVASDWSPWKPELNEMISLDFVDFIVKEKLFNFFLWFGCIKETKENQLMIRMTKHNPWPKPIPVYGYDRSWMVFGGNVFEAGTNCAGASAMGAIPTALVTNLSFFSIGPRLTRLPDPNPSQPITYDNSKTYIALVIGDGDNIDFVKTTRKIWMQERVARCNKDSSKKGCFPLLWSLSPHLPHHASSILSWYYNQTYITGHDHFVLPPCGHLYSYPSTMASDAQAQFVQKTEQDCQMMNTNAVVGWEWMGTWERAFQEYFPRYSKNNIVQAVFAVNVPYLIPALAFPLRDTYRIVNDNVVVFKPREWRGIDERMPKYFHLSTKNMAGEINRYERGTVTHIYTTSDGGFDIGHLYDMVAQLDDHVVVVDSKQIANLALQRSQKV